MLIRELKQQRGQRRRQQEEEKKALGLDQQNNNFFFFSWTCMIQSFSTQLQKNLATFDELNEME